MVKPAELPGKSANARTEQRRADLIDTATRLFLDRGYHEVTVADIVAELGVSHGTFYNYFDNRRDILDAVVDARFAEISVRVLGAVDKSPRTMGEFLAAATGIARRMHALLAAEPGLVQFLAFEAPAIDQELIDRLDRLLDDTALLARTRLDDGVRAGYLRADLDSAIVARSVMALIFSTAIAALFEPDDLPEDELLAGLSDILRHALGTG